MIINEADSDADEIVSNVHVSWRVVICEVVQIFVVGSEILIAKGSKIKSNL